MTLRDMLYIVTIAEEKSITKAASRLFIAQPALSQCLQKVERELGGPIFLRTSVGVQATEEGRCFLSFAQTVLQEQKNFEKRMTDIQQNAGGEVRIGLTGTQATYVLPYFLPQFNALYPRTEVILFEEPSDTIETKLVSGEIDLGIIHPPVCMEGIRCFELCYDELVVVPRSTSQYQPYIYRREGEGDDRPYLNLAFLQDEPIALPYKSQRSRMVIDQMFLRAGITPVIKQVSKRLIALDALAQVDYATVLLPRKQLSTKLNRRDFFYIDSKYAPDYPFYVAVQQAGYRSRATECLLELLMSIRDTF